MSEGVGKWRNGVYSPHGEDMSDAEVADELESMQKAVEALHGPDSLTRLIGEAVRRLRGEDSGGPGD